MHEQKLSQLLQPTASQQQERHASRCLTSVQNTTAARSGSFSQRPDTAFESASHLAPAAMQRSVSAKIDVQSDIAAALGHRHAYGTFSGSTAQQDAVPIEAALQSNSHLLQQHDGKPKACQQPAPPSKRGKCMKPTPRARVLTTKAWS